MIFYRAIPVEQISLGKFFKQKTIRLPSNVPYFVDNIWDFFRPEEKPSRRYAVYASPTKELALKNASQSLSNNVYELEFSYEAKFMQLSVVDARYHPDIKNLQKLVNNYVAKLNLEQKQMISLLFVPGVLKEEINENMNYIMSDLLNAASKVVSIWQDLPHPDGELFFELDNNDQHYYVLNSIKNN